MNEQERAYAAIERLASALYELGYRGGISTKPAVRLLLAPGQCTTDNLKHVHTFGLTPALADLLADAIEQLLVTLDTTPAGETVSPQGAAEFARLNPQLAAAVASAFQGIDADAIATALDETGPQINENQQENQGEA